MASSNKSNSTVMALILFLLLVATIVTGSLYLDMRHKNKLLEAKIDQLEKSQVLLMVPDEQAQALADWMTKNPQMTESLIKQVKPGMQTKVEIGPGVTDVNPLADAQNKRQDPLGDDLKPDASNKTDAIKLSEDQDGVKVISLPHGGIRVTTREDN